MWPPASVFADSDGYFCVGHGYVAYERRLPTTPVTHSLHVVRFGPAGLMAAPPLALDDFQVHGMACRRDAVELLGWNTAYLVDISDPAHARVTSRAAAFDPTQSTPAENLGLWAKATVIDLPVEGSSRFQLVISKVSQRVSRGIEHHIVSRLIRRGPNAGGTGIMESMTLFEGVFRETVN